MLVVAVNARTAGRVGAIVGVSDVLRCLRDTPAASAARFVGGSPIGADEVASFVAGVWPVKMYAVQLPGSVIRVLQLVRGPFFEGRAK